MLTAEQKLCELADGLEAKAKDLRNLARDFRAAAADPEAHASRLATQLLGEIREIEHWLRNSAQGLYGLEALKKLHARIYGSDGG